MGNRKGIMGNIIIDVNSAYNYLKTSPMFKLSLSSKELFHSNFLEWLSNVDQDAFKRLILYMADLEEGYEWPEVWRVKREYNNFDLCIVAYDQYGEDNENEKDINDDTNDSRILFVIENKVKSIPYKEQLQRYAIEAEKLNILYWKKKAKEELIIEPNNGQENHSTQIEIKEGKWIIKAGVRPGRRKPIVWDESRELEVPVTIDCTSGKKNQTQYINSYLKWKENKIKPNFILLTLATTFPNKDGNTDKWEIDGNIWKICSYDKYRGLIEKAYENKNGFDKQIIDDYCAFISCLTLLSEEWKQDYADDRPFLYSDNVNYKNAKKTRIHDLYQKLKFSYLCTTLFNEVKSIYNKRYYVYPSNQGGLFKENKSDRENWGREKNYICVNYTYLHGDPLLEINIHPRCKSGKPELYYAIQVQGSAYEHGIQVKGNKANAVWDYLSQGKIHIIDGWMNIGNKTTWKECNQKDFNKYDMSDGTYIYQKYPINSNSKIKDILDKMLSDLDYLIKKLP